MRTRLLLPTIVNTVLFGYRSALKCGKNEHTLTRMHAKFWKSGKTTKTTTIAEAAATTATATTATATIETEQQHRVSGWKTLYRIETLPPACLNMHLLLAQRTATASMRQQQQQSTDRIIFQFVHLGSEHSDSVWSGQPIEVYIESSVCGACVQIFSEYYERLRTRSSVRNEKRDIASWCSGWTLIKRERKKECSLWNEFLGSSGVGSRRGNLKFRVNTLNQDLFPLY